MDEQGEFPMGISESHLVVDYVGVWRGVQGGNGV